MPCVWCRSTRDLRVARGLAFSDARQGADTMSAPHEQRATGNACSSEGERRLARQSMHVDPSPSRVARASCPRSRSVM